MKNISLHTILLLGIMTVTFTSFAQRSDGGLPLSFIYDNIDDNYQKMTLPSLDKAAIMLEDSMLEASGFPLRNGIITATNIQPSTHGTWNTLEDGTRIWRIMVSSEQATGLVCYYSVFNIPNKASLYIYDVSKEHLLGAYTSANNMDGGAFATELMASGHFIMEYNAPANVNEMPGIHINGISQVYRGTTASKGKGFGSSGWCEVNVNCSPEGDKWQDEKRGVARILLKIGTGTFWCSGSLLNNIQQNEEPLFLTADHCGQDASTQDLTQWIYYFNYESPGCSDPPSEPQSKTIVGCQRLASSGGMSGSVEGSDFFLVLLSQAVPDNFNVYYNGWSASNTASNSGVSIHHPAGDIKKISHYTTPTYSTQWGGNPNSHWGVDWVETQNGHGVTEGGSSGSPLFNSGSRIMGTLSGGDASCSNLNLPDLYGKFSYSWDRPGSSPDNRLKDWLDPDATGITTIGGTYGNVIHVVADFYTDTTIIPVGSTLQFTDKSFGNPTSWEWYFEGGTPQTSEIQHPSNIRFNHTGSFSMSLTVSNAETRDSIIKLAYIKVIPNIYPNPPDVGPPDNYYNIDFGNRTINDLEMSVYDVMGRPVVYRIEPGASQGIIRIYINTHSAGIYILRVKTSYGEESFKLVQSN